LRTSISKVELNASIPKVWNALTNPDLVKLWQYGSVLTTTWEPNTSICFATEWNGQRFEQWGKVIEFIPYSAIKYSLFAPRPDLTDSPENYFFMTYRLTEQDGRTLLEITQDDPRPLAESETIATEDEDNENPILQMLKNLVEKTL